MRNKLLALHTVENTHPGFSIDCVILGFNKKKIQVLLSHVDRMNYWQLPGGFMFNTETSDDAAYRVLKERTGLKDIYLKQFHLFSNPNRMIFEQSIELLNPDVKKSMGKEERDFFMKRFISLGYYALVKYDEVNPQHIGDSETKWFDVNQLPPLYIDHKYIIDTAMAMIKVMHQLLPVGYKLLPEKFTMSELRKIYEIILDKPLDRRNFQKKVLSSGILIQLEESKKEDSYNPPILYSFAQGRQDAIGSSFTFHG